MSDDWPDDLAERVQMMENILINRATGGSSAETHTYEHLRRSFIENDELKPLLPDFVRTCRTLDAFWPYIKDRAGSYKDRSSIIRSSFNAVHEYLEGKTRVPADEIAHGVLSKFDSDTVHAIWSKALKRRVTDPEGAITVARTLLESVCKRVLEEHEGSAAYNEKDDLPKLYGRAAKCLNLAPDQHSQEAIRAILGGAMAVANGIGTLRNKLSDAHGRGKLGSRPTTRHANLAVNMAGALATFLVETHIEKSAAS